MDKIILELTADGTDGKLRTNIDINRASSRLPSYMLVIIKKLAEIDEAAFSMAVNTYFDKEEG